MSGTIIRTKFYVRGDVICMPYILVAFGDNMHRKGFGGQAKACRGLENTIGIITKWYPHMGSLAFLSDRDIDNPEVTRPIDAGFKQLAYKLEQDGIIAWPQDGVGTGLAELPKRAPKIQSYIEGKYEELEIMADNIIKAYYLTGAYLPIKGAVPQELLEL